jgi:hypothetical protein
MTSLPSAGDRPDVIDMPVAREFLRNGKEAVATASEREEWTDTPAEREAKAAKAAMALGTYHGGSSQPMTLAEAVALAKTTTRIPVYSAGYAGTPLAETPE